MSNGPRHRLYCSGVKVTIRRRRSGSLILFLSVLLGGALAGGWIGPIYSTALAAEPGEAEDPVGVSLRQFSQALAIVEQSFSDPIESEAAIYEGAIPRMLQSLDPHSSFFDSKAFARMQEDHQGRYAGVGMVIQTRRGKTVVVHPFPDTPAFRGGMRPGDVIAEVAGESMEGLTSDEVVQRLRGPEGLPVEVGYERLGREGLTYVNLSRASIPRPSIPVAFEIRDKVPFIRIETFNENTGRELDEAMARLGADAIEGLVLDLRDNRGGILQEAVHVSGVFLEPGQTVVSQHGRSSTEQVYRAEGSAAERKFPVVVMVNCNSASASEIVAGALQDHDRALVVGANTFGKGLVQSLFRLGDQAGLALTTARYYTPSGRLIQREYGGVSLSDYYSDPCSEKFEPVRDQVALTDKGRQVFSGGGIAPDIELEPRPVNELQVALARSFAVDRFVQQYLLDREPLSPDWQPELAVLDAFEQSLIEDGIEFDGAELAENGDYILREIKRQAFTAAFDLDEGQRAYFAIDPDVERALDLLPTAQALLDNAAELVARR